MTGRRLGRAGAAATLVLTAGCFATRNDMRILQGDILSFRTEAARADSARARQLAAVAASLGTVADSVRATSDRLTRFQGDSRGELRAIQQQLLQIQELTGQSQRRLQEMRAEMEARAQQAVAPPVVAPPGDTSAIAPVQAAPGPNQLYQLAYDQLRRGSYSAARAGFEELLRRYPTSELAPDAQINIAEAYAAEGTSTAADSAYAAVVEKYPRSMRASTALYKLALSIARQGRRADARTTMDRVVREYPTSDEADLAREWLRTNR
ncbi:MAG TPA: tol-pal system protein YbgF [Gemmatimonadaceae bacterium]|nr:tol-pal system protein YbgF [Gemmatimonadaceae bacterium]